MPDNNKDRANLGEQISRRDSSSEDVLSKGIDRAKEDLSKLERDVDDLTIRRGTERDRDVRERSQAERESGKFERSRSDVHESTRDTGSTRRADSVRGTDASDTGSSQGGSTGGSKGGKVAGSGFTMEETEESKKGYSSTSSDRLRESQSGKRSGSLSEPERQRDRDLDRDRNRDIDRSKM